MLISRSKKVIKRAIERLNAELQDKNLPRHRRNEVKGAIYYLNEDLKYLKNKKRKEGP